MFCSCHDCWAQSLILWTFDMKNNWIVTFLCLSASVLTNDSVPYEINVENFKWFIFHVLPVGMKTHPFKDQESFNSTPYSTETRINIHLESYHFTDITFLYYFLKLLSVLCGWLHFQASLFLLLGVFFLV